MEEANKKELEITGTLIFDPVTGQFVEMDNSDESWSAECISEMTSKGFA